jgi:3-hydroxyisobutyrate dehydrogenase
MTAKIAFVGLGAMGLPMASALVEAGYGVTGFDLNPASLARFQALGGKVAASMQAAARAADVLILMVVNIQQVNDVLFEQDTLSVLAEDAVVIVSSTIAPDDAEAVADKLSAVKLQLVDAPVSGGVRGAVEKTLSMMASGPRQAYSNVEAILNTMGSHIYYLGERNGQGCAMKVVNQLLAGVHLASAAEAVNFASSYGLDIAQVQEVIASSAGNSWMFQDRVPRMIQANPEVKSAIDIFVKDLGIVADVAHTAKVAVPLAAAALQLFTMASVKGLGQADDSQVIKVLGEA